MAKKKNHGKKHKFKYADTSNPQVAAAIKQHEGPLPNSPVGAKPKPGAATAMLDGDFRYVFFDLKRIVFMAVSLVALELALWALLSRTGVGDTVYNLIKL